MASILGTACVLDEPDLGDAGDSSRALTSDEGQSPVRVLGHAEEARMQRYIDNLYRKQDVVHSFSLGSNDEVDCVELHAQPALREPDMAGHVVKMAPRTVPASLETSTGTERAHDPMAMLRGDLDDHGRARACPKGSVPILRLTLDQLKRFRTMEDFRRKYPNHVMSDGKLLAPDIRGSSPATTSRAITPSAVGSTDSHQYAQTNQVLVGNWGAESYINLWNPTVEKTTEFSLSQIWVWRGSSTSGTLETVEVGVQKYQDFYGDGQPRLFIYFTPDNYGSGGCYNLTCGGFVQTNNTIVIGGPFSQYSTDGGTQKEFQILWYKDTTTGDWWLRYFNTWVGYYPRTKFDTNGLRDQAGGVAFGGEIIDDEPGYHTQTDMGSGAWPSTGWQHAAFQRKLLYVNTSGVYTDPGALSPLVTDSRCYDAIMGNDPGNWGRYFFYGGPGYNTNCQ